MATTGNNHRIMEEELNWTQEDKCCIFSLTRGCELWVFGPTCVFNLECL